VNSLTTTRISKKLIKHQLTEGQLKRVEALIDDYIDDKEVKAEEPPIREEGKKYTRVRNG